MLGLTYPKWLNFLLFQSIWFAGILGQASLEWLIAALLVAHLVMIQDLKSELWMILPIGAIGVVADIILTLNDVFIFDPAPSPLPIPLWLVGIWLGFAATLRHSMSYLMARPMIAIVAAAIGAPLSYLAGMRLGAVAFGLDVILTMLVLAVLWACLMAVFIRLYDAEQPASREAPSEAA